MKKLLSFLLYLFIAFKVCGQVDTIIEDKDGNVYSVKTMPDHKLWMTMNLNMNIPGTYCYENKPDSCKKYGRLYTWKAAVEGCRLLGEGWRLATNEDWQKMIKFYGGVRGDSE